jgi:hypothetical protein
MRIATAAAVLVFALLTAGCASQPASASATPADIIQARCTKCHNTDRIKAANHDLAAWTATVARMKGKGAQLTSAEEAAVVQFLASGGGSRL